MKLLVFSPYYPPHTGGLETHSDEFNKHLSQQEGIDITVFTTQLPLDSPEREIKYNHVTIIRFPAFEIISNYPIPKIWLPKFWKLFFSLFKTKYSVILSRTRFFITSPMALVVAKVSRTKWIHIEHGSDFVKLSSSFKSLIAKIYDYSFGRAIFQASDVNISISKAVQVFVQRFDQRISPIIYRGIDFEMIDSVSPNPEIRKIHQKKIIISTVARLYKWKGVEHTINAIKSLPNKIKTRIIFNIIGDGEDFSRLQKLAKGEPIQLWGALEGRRTLALIKSSDIYIHSSLPGGGLSTSLLEAMYCGCAVIATPNEGADEVVLDGKNGLIIPKSSPKAIRKAIERLILDEHERENISGKAMPAIRETFGWKRSIAEYLDIFKKIEK